MSFLPTAIQDHIAALVAAERGRLESQLAEAIVGQATDRLDHLHIVARYGLNAPLADQVGWVASSLAPVRGTQMALLQLVQDYEREHGVITDEELADLEKRWLE